MRAWAALLAGVVALAAPAARAEPAEAIVRAQLAALLPPDLGVDAVHLPRSLARADLDPARVVVELPRAARPGRASARVTTPDGAQAYVPVTLVVVGEVAITRRALVPGDTIGESDVERTVGPTARAAAAELVVGARVTRPIARGAVVGARDLALAAPLPRGAEVTIELRRGAVTVRGPGVLELAARPGAPATARLSATRQVVHGALRAPATVVVGGAP